jgi:SAM-dependent methyltransferase
MRGEFPGRLPLGAPVAEAGAGAEPQGDAGLPHLLDVPFVYRLIQHVLAPGAEGRVTAGVRRVLGRVPAPGRILEVGCGPHSFLWRVGLQPLGLDLTPAYCRRFRAAGGRAVVGSADALPFPSGAFEGVWSFGMFHHLPDAVAARALREMVRVCGDRGHVVVFDSVLPAPWRRPIPWLLCQIDRGRHARPQPRLEALLPDRPSWIVERLTYTWLGAQGVFCARLPGG